MQTVIDWQFAQASQAGRGKGGNPARNQDACHVHWLGADRGVLVVCDGAGSAPRSRQGAMLVSRALGCLTGQVAALLICDLDRTQLAGRWEHVAREEFLRAQALLSALAERLGCPARHLACTAILLAFSPDRLLCAHVGDGRAAYSLGPGHWDALFQPHHGAMMGETLFVTSQAWHDDGFWPRCTQVITQPVRAFAAMTDGVERGAFVCARPRQDDPEVIVDPNEPHPPFFEGVLHGIRGILGAQRGSTRANQALRHFLKEGLEAFRSTEDDKTLVLVARAEHASTPSRREEAMP